MSPFVEAYLAPSSSAVKFAIKGVLAMFLALYIAMWADLDRPYWALISAAFLQIRPMSGMVIEKGLCQLGGTLIGALVGIAVMALFAQAREPALLALTLWIMLCVYTGSVTRNNLSYGCLMAAVTALLIVIISGSDPASVFDTAVARLSELGLGAICATLVSALLWPTHVQDHLAGQADTAVNQAFVHAAQSLENETDDNALQATLTASLTPLNLLGADSQAARYEGPAGPGRVRAANLLGQHCLILFATLAALRQMLREAPDQVGGELRDFAREIAEGLRQAEQAVGVPRARPALQRLRHAAHRYDMAELTPLQQRMVLGLRDVLGHATILLDAREAIARPGRRRLRGASLSWHRDPWLAASNAARTGLVFSILALFWLATGWDNGPMAMMLATLFSAFFANRDNPLTISRMFLKGMLLAIPSAFLFGQVLLAQATGFPLLMLLFGTPLFLGLLGAGHPATMGYSLAFTIFNIMLVMPDNRMGFQVDSFFNRAIAVGLGVTVTVLAFRLFSGPGASWMQYRLREATSRDLRQLARRRRRDAQAWFGGRMADRLLRLARHDEMLPETNRHLFQMGLCGLDIGLAMLRLRNLLDPLPGSAVQEARRTYLWELAEAYAISVRGNRPVALPPAADRLLAACRDAQVLEPQRLARLQGLLERLELTLWRQADLSRPE